MSVHIYPLDDTHTHSLSSECACRPAKDPNGYLIHNSFDGRESHPNNGGGTMRWTFEITDANEDIL